MAPTPREHYEELLERVSLGTGSWKDRDVCLFAAQRGAHYAGSLLVVGRATNGWRNPFLAGTLTSREGREDATAKAFADDAGEEDPMAWVSRQWSGAQYAYKTGRSAFWRVVRETVSNLDIAEADDPTWASSIAWTNLYKVAPDGSNPPDSLAYAQLASCIDILRAEIDQLQPQRVLFLTGDAWAGDFLDGLGFTPTSTPLVPPVEAAGTVEGGARVVVVPHPQSRSEGPFVREITRALSD